jgi:hypothetical protein
VNYRKAVSKIGSLLHKEPAVDNAVVRHELSKKVTIGVKIQTLMNHPAYPAFKELMQIRINELMAQIRNPNNKERYEELSYRLDEHDQIESMMNKVVVEGDDADIKLRNMKEEGGSNA